MHIHHRNSTVVTDSQCLSIKNKNIVGLRSGLAFIGPESFYSTTDKSLGPQSTVDHSLGEQPTSNCPLSSNVAVFIRPTYTHDQWLIGDLHQSGLIKGNQLVRGAVIMERQLSDIEWVLYYWPAIGGVEDVRLFWVSPIYLLGSLRCPPVHLYYYQWNSVLHRWHFNSRTSWCWCFI